MLHYIFDCNNIIGKSGSLSKIKIKDPQGSREQIVFLIEKFLFRKKVKASLHFDGYEKERINFKIGKIIYSNSKKADDLIKKEIAESSNPKNIIVVTSDGNLKEFAKVNSCSIIPSEEFLSGITNNKEENDEKDISGRISNDEIKKLFGV